MEEVQDNAASAWDGIGEKCQRAMKEHAILHIRKLEAENDRLIGRIAHLEQESAVLCRRNEQLEQELAQLKASNPQ